MKHAGLDEIEVILNECYCTKLSVNLFFFRHLSVRDNFMAAILKSTKRCSNLIIQHIIYCNYFKYICNSM